MTQIPRPPLVTSADKPCFNPFQIGKGRRMRGWYGHGHKPYQNHRQAPNAKNMGLLDGGAATIFQSLMGAYFLPATLHQAGALVYTDGVITSNGAADIDAKAQVDNASYRMQQSANYIDGDVRLLILASQVTTDDELTVSGQRYKIYAVSRDPAGSHWDCAGRVA